MCHGKTALTAAFALCLCLGCSSPDEGDPDGGADAGDGGDGGDVGPAECTGPADCSDGLFCSGVERCAPEDPGADEHGCVPAAEGPCMPSQECDEDTNECRTSCDLDPDADGDGHRATECGGDDCDDADGDRYPGNTEVCDDDDLDGDGEGEGHDEDCNPATLGDDSDGDTFVSDECCNPQGAGDFTCGPDCDDSTAEINPTAPESCNGVDDNCRDGVDEGVLSLFWPDEDSDGYGDAEATPVEGCSAPPDHVDTGGDCLDSDDSVHPGQHELCNAVDDNCDGVIDETPDAVDNSCPSDLPGTTFACVDGACEVDVCPADLLDCNGAAGDGCEVDALTDREHCGDCATECSFTCVDGLCDELESIAAGGGHSCAQRSTGLVSCWGRNDAGQLGVSSFIEYHHPVEVLGLADAAMVEVGYAHSCAARNDGYLYCWGSNLWAQLGLGSAHVTMHPSPTLVRVFRESPAAVHVSLGDLHTCAIGESTSGARTAYCWGANAHGQIGNGSADDTLVLLPTLVRASLSEVFEDAEVVEAGSAHTCAIAVGGQVWCWGFGTAGRLGDGLLTAHDVVYPLAVAGLTDATDLGVGGSHSCAIRAGGQVYCWGSNTGWQLGIGPGDDQGTPVAVSGLSDAVALSLGASHSCAVRTSGETLCWGSNVFGQVGDGTTAERSALATVSTLVDPVGISAGQSHTCAIRPATEGQQAVCWGHNAMGQLGDATTIERHVPTDVDTLFGL